MKMFMLAGAACALLAASGPALAQGTGGSNAAIGFLGARTITCKEFLGMSADHARDTAYYVSGYVAGLSDRTPAAPINSGASNASGQGKPANAVATTAPSTLDQSPDAAAPNVTVGQLQQACHDGQNATLLQALMQQAGAGGTAAGGAPVPAGGNSAVSRLGTAGTATGTAGAGTTGTAGAGTTGNPGAASGATTGTAATPGVPNTGTSTANSVTTTSPNGTTTTTPASPGSAPMTTTTPGAPAAPAPGVPGTGGAALPSPARPATTLSP